MVADGGGGGYFVEKLGKEYQHHSGVFGRYDLEMSRLSLEIIKVLWIRIGMGHGHFWRFFEGERLHHAPQLPALPAPLRDARHRRTASRGATTASGAWPHGCVDGAMPLGLMPLLQK